MAPRRILIIGGTVEAAQLAAGLENDPIFEPITSLAGRTRDPAPLPGTVRTGGFGGPEGLAHYLTAAEICAVADATHPFAEQITRNAAEACRTTGVPYLRLERPPWKREPEDHWIDVADAEEAARRLDGHGSRVFLSIGRQELLPFENLRDIWFLLRMIDPPSGPIPLAHCDVILGRGPFEAESEVNLLAKHRIDTLVSKNSGGDATYGKIMAARRLGLPVIMIRRPAAPLGKAVDTVTAAMDWIVARSADERGIGPKFTLYSVEERQVREEADGKNHRIPDASNK